MSNELVIWDSPNGINLSYENVSEIVLHEGKLLRNNERRKISTALANELYDMSSEYIWNRTLSILKEKILTLGEEFVLEMLDRSLDDNIENVSYNEFINLAAELGFINNIARDKFVHANVLINHFQSRDAEEEMSFFDMQTIIIPCIQYVLGLDENNFSISFNSFRDQLKLRVITEDDDIYTSLLISPYFYKRTTIKTLLNLTKSTQGGELDNVLANTVNIFNGIWEALVTDDKYTIGKSYAEAINNSNKKLSVTLRRVLLENGGFNYVPENLRSQSFIKYAKKLKNAHYSYDNFYKEPIPAKDLSNMGTIPAPALSHCLSASIISKLGNMYGVSSSAQIYVDKILSTIPQNRWEFYFNDAFIVDIDVLNKLKTNNNIILDRWIQLVNSINERFPEIRIKEPDSKSLYDASLASNKSKISTISNKIIKKIQ